MVSITVKGMMKHYSRPIMAAKITNDWRHHDYVHLSSFIYSSYYPNMWIRLHHKIMNIDETSCSGCTWPSNSWELDMQLRKLMYWWLWMRVRPTPFAKKDYFYDTVPYFRHGNCKMKTRYCDCVRVYIDDATHLNEGEKEAHSKVRQPVYCAGDHEGSRSVGLFKQLPCQDEGDATWHRERKIRQRQR